LARQSQVVNGKAFEYCVAIELSNRLDIQIRKGPELETCHLAYQSISPELATQMVSGAAIAVDHVIDLEKKRLDDAKLNEIWIAADARGQKGDVRDVVIETSQGQMGISCKNNHEAFKHSRLSGTINFVKKWGLDPAGCSEEYWARIRPIFNELKVIRRESNGEALFRDLDDVPGRFYQPVLSAFSDELKRVSISGPSPSGSVPLNLVTYVVGRQDFYKVIRESASVVVQGFNFNGSLSTSRTRGPSHLIGIDRLDGSDDSITVRLNRGFTFNFRIHSAKSSVEPSLKFDITAVSLPPAEIYVNHLRIQS
jgi:hypothetical protein